MKNIIPLDTNARMVIEPDNYILQYRRKSKASVLTWRTEGYFPDLTSICTEYINNAPRRSENAIKSIRALIEAIEKAEENIKKILNQKIYDRE